MHSAYRSARFRYGCPKASFKVVLATTVGAHFTIEGKSQKAKTDSMSRCSQHRHNSAKQARDTLKLDALYDQITAPQSTTAQKGTRTLWGASRVVHASLSLRDLRELFF